MLNKPYLPYPGQAKWRVAAKWVLRHTRRKKRIPECASRIPANVAAKLSVREEQNFTRDLLPSRSPFRFRFAPPPDYLNWRYNTSLPFVRYRLFRDRKSTRLNSSHGYITYVVFCFKNRKPFNTMLNRNAARQMCVI